MRRMTRGVLIAAACLFVAGTAALAQGQRGNTSGVEVGTVRRTNPINPDEVPKRKKPAPNPPRGTYKPPRTPWGDPDIAGAYNNSDESSIPFERPNEFAGRTLDSFTATELEQLTKQRQERTIESNPTLSEFPGATSPMHWFENYFAANSRAWLVADPPDGKVPPQTDEARQRTAARESRLQFRIGQLRPFAVGLDLCDRRRVPARRASERDPCRGKLDSLLTQAAGSAAYADGQSKNHHHHSLHM